MSTTHPQKPFDPISNAGMVNSVRPAISEARASAVLDIDRLIDDRATSIIVCCGAGGVGKTTVAAALGVRAAERGRRVAVLTIDPARRLAQSLGLNHLDNTPRTVPGCDSAAGGSLQAMMLDMKRTFDELVEAHASPAQSAAILANPLYISLSESFAGTQEYMAMEKLSQLHHSRDTQGNPRWDLIIVDTPPARAALDFLDAPSRLGSFLDSRFLRVLTTPARAGGRVYAKAMSTGFGIAEGVLSKLVGTALLHDVRSLVSALDTTFGGFRERAEHTYALLQDGGTAFVVVATPDRDSMNEADHFMQRLRAEHMPLAGVVINRVTYSSVPLLSPQATARALERADNCPGEASASVHWLLRVHMSQAELADHDARWVGAFSREHVDVAVQLVPAQAVDIHDLAGLRSVAALLAHRR